MILAVENGQLVDFNRTEDAEIAVPSPPLANTDRAAHLRWSIHSPPPTSAVLHLNG